MKTSNSSELDLVLVIPKDIESNLHKKFASCRIKGDWFFDDGVISNYITSIKEAQNATV